jgi:hypothetical protein
MMLTVVRTCQNLLTMNIISKHIIPVSDYVQGSSVLFIPVDYE